MKKTPTMGRPGVALLLSLIVLTTAGCSAAGSDVADVSNGPGAQVTDLYSGETPSSTGGGAVPPLSGFPGNQSGWLVPYVFEILGPTVEQQVVIEQGSYVLVRHCMAERGFELLNEPPSATPPSRSTMGFDYRVGIISQERASQSGYQYRDGDFGFSRLAMNVATTLPGWTREYERAYKGDDGCLGEPDLALEEGVSEQSDEVWRLAREIDEQSVERAWAEPVVTAALDRWRSCMAREGYSFATPKEAYDAFTGFVSTAAAPRPGDSTATPSEIVTAVWDASCKAESGLGELWPQELWRARWTMIQDNLPNLLVVQETTARRVVNAQALIERYG
ncbi:MAG: hypothetical protein LBK54_00865 [Propionibacteriaceae bacterium]|nr:hypothetical protein [Propionibacteriaceae bacterium]